MAKDNIGAIPGGSLGRLQRAAKPVVKVKVKPNDPTIANAKVVRNDGGLKGKAAKNVNPVYKETGNVNVIPRIDQTWAHYTTPNRIKNW